jgi:CheY-like chemotaxis protein
MAGPKDDNFRRSRTVEAAFRVRYRSIQELALAVGNDLARRSLFIRTARALPIDAIIRLYLELPEGGGTVPVLARVAFARPQHQAASSGKQSGVGVELLDLTPDRLAAIKSFVAEQGSKSTSPAEPSRLDIVIADDDAGWRAWVARVLGSRGDRVRQAVDGLEALTACLNEPPDLLLSDVQMPRMDGWQLLRMLRAPSSLVQIPIVLLTTLKDDAARLEGYRLGVDDFIGKPVLDYELTVRIDRIVTRARQQSSNHRPALRGDLEHVAMVSLLSFLAVEGKTGVLEVVGTASARLFLRAGRLLRADIDDVPAASADDPSLTALLSWSRGRFEFLQQEVVCNDELHTSVKALLRAQPDRDERTEGS